jgi:hypothetical protein
MRVGRVRRCGGETDGLLDNEGHRFRRERFEGEVVEPCATRGIVGRQEIPDPRQKLAGRRVTAADGEVRGRLLGGETQGQEQERGNQQDQRGRGGSGLRVP